jgi:hypothetical protein
VIVVVQWRRLSDFDVGEYGARRGIVEAQDATGGARCSSEVANEDVAMAIESHSRGDEESGNDFFRNGSGDANDAARSGRRVAGSAGEFEDINATLVVDANIDNGCEPRPVVNDEAFVIDLVKPGRPYNNRDSAEISDIEAVVALGDAGGNHVPDHGGDIGELFNPGSAPVGDVDAKQPAMVRLDDQQITVERFHVVRRAVGLEVIFLRMRDRMDPVELTQVGDNIHAAIFMDADYRGREIRIAVRATPTGDQSIELAVNERDVRGPDGVARGEAAVGGG